MKKYFILLVIFSVSCSLPKDPEDSYNEAKEDGLRVGYVYNPPYSYKATKEAQGNEVVMIKEFAETEGLDVEYTYGSESELIRKMENYQLHLLIGGFKKNTVWKDKAGLSTAYNDKKNCILVARGENKLLYKLESYLLNNKDKNGN